MSVIVKGMEMPDSCIACKFGREVNYTGDFEEKCLINDKCGYVSVRKPRLDTCPLVEVKEPHGRLGDLDALWDRMYKYIDNEGAKMPFGYDDFMIHRDSACELIEDAPTVIEAEGSKNE